MANTSFKKQERKVRKLTVSVSDLGHDVVALNSLTVALVTHDEN